MQVAAGITDPLEAAMTALVLVTALALAIVQASPSPAASQPPIDHARAAAEFESRVNAYVALHRKLEGTVPTIAVSADYGRVKAAIEALATQIRAARREARRGDVFTADVECWLRQTIDTSLKGCDISALRAALNEENPPNQKFTLKINGPWPKGASLGPMPPRLLRELPPLPDDLQYRLLDRDLVLWDAHANLIVDFMRGVLPDK
jgi:hypothetical protein